jgi:hypothetical protein
MEGLFSAPPAGTILLGADTSLNAQLDELRDRIENIEQHLGLR